MRRPARLVRRVLAVLALLVVGFAVLTPVGRYLSRAAWAEGKILARRRPIARLIASPTTDAITRAKLELVLAARTFAVESLGLAARGSFTTYSRLDSDTLVLVVSAAHRDRLTFHTWWFPIVGRVPYKGFFSPMDALAEARRLEGDGMDTYVRAASAFSTLGWFNDPLVSSTLHEDSTSLANTVMHELTHNTFFAPGQVVFNESFASFVGAHGAMWFFRVRGDTARLRESENDWAREKVLGAFWDTTYRSLDSAFRAHPGGAGADARLVARDTVFARARARFAHDVLPRLPGVPPGTHVELRLNNAIVLARRVYRTGLDLFDSVLVREGGDLRRAIRRIIALARSRPDDPYGAIRAWLASPAGPASTLSGAAAPGLPPGRAAEAPAQKGAQIERRRGGAGRLDAGRGDGRGGHVLHAGAHAGVDEARELVDRVVGAPARTVAVERVQDGQMMPRAGHRHVHQPALFLRLLRGAQGA